MGRKVWVPVVSGPLAAYAAGFASWLRFRAYSPAAAADRLYQFDQLSRWLEREGLGVGELTGEQAERFIAARRAAGRVTWVSPQSVVLPLGYLRELGVAPVPEPALAHGLREELLAGYHRYLLIERGLSQHTVLDAYGPVARLFLAGREGPDGLELERLRAADVSMFPARECPKRSVSGCQRPSSSPQRRPWFLPSGGHLFSPLVAMFLPAWGSPPVVAKPSPEGEASGERRAARGQARGLTPLPAVAWARR